MHQETAWTIGHSTRSLEDFISVLKSFEIQCLVDIRGLPGSKRYPHFNKEVMEKELPANQIRYMHIPKLGGRRKVKKFSKNTDGKLCAYWARANAMSTVIRHRQKSWKENWNMKDKYQCLCRGSM